MAGVLEKLTVPQAAAFSEFRLPTISSSSINSLSVSRNLTRLPEFRGLKIKSTSSIRSLGSVGSSSRFVRTAGRIVSESQDTAVEGAVPSVTDKTWQSEVLQCSTPVLVEFWAPWCGPCRMIHPVIDELAKEYAGRLKCYKVNTDESPDTASTYGIRSIPTVIIFKNGEKKDAVIGAVPKSTLTTSIEKYL